MVGMSGRSQDLVKTNIIVKDKCNNDLHYHVRSRSFLGGSVFDFRKVFTHLHSKFENWIWLTNFVINL